MSESQKRGWGEVVNGRKWHYFNGFRSLCGRYGYLGLSKHLQDSNHDSPDNCKACAEARLKLYPDA